jgi:hypothetical protein
MTNNKQQTAVEWLYNQRIERPLADWDYLLQQAKEMEKEKSINDFKMGIRNAIQMEATKDAEQYYNETYGGDK